MKSSQELHKTSLIIGWQNAKSKFLKVRNSDGINRLYVPLLMILNNLPLQGEGTKPRVGVVGEILVKFHPTANNQVVDVIEAEGCEAVVPGLIEFFLFAIAGSIFQKDPLGKSKKGAVGAKVALNLIAKLRKPANDALAAS